MLNRLCFATSLVLKLHEDTNNDRAEICADMEEHRRLDESEPGPMRAFTVKKRGGLLLLSKNQCMENANI
jgi:hypothetical protein